MIRTLLPLSLLLLVACGGNKKSSGAAASSSSGSAAAEESIDGAIYPDDANSKAFVERLIRVSATNFKPTDSGAGTDFVYKTLDFRNNNKWFAEASMTAAGETMECKEEGTWEMDPAMDDHTATLKTKLTRTSCAGRPENELLRLKVKIEKGEYTIVFQ